MSQVTLDIGGRSYTVSCGEGEEAHILKLGRMIDEKVVSITSGKPGAETQALLFASLLLADELYETGNRSASNDPATADALERVAEAMEACAESLESARATS